MARWSKESKEVLTAPGDIFLSYIHFVFLGDFLFLYSF